MGIFVPDINLQSAPGDNPLLRRYADQALQSRLRLLIEGAQAPPPDAIENYIAAFGPGTQDQSASANKQDMLPQGNKQPYGVGGPKGDQLPGPVVPVQPFAPPPQPETNGFGGGGVGTAVGDAVGGAAQYVGQGLQKWTQPMNTPIIQPSWNYPQPVNAAIEAGNWFTGGLDKDAQLMNQGIAWMTQPASKTAPGQYAASQGAQPQAAPQAQPGQEYVDFKSAQQQVNPQAASGTSPQAGGPSGNTAPLIEYPAPDLPKPPELTAYQAPPPPQPAPYPAAPQVQMPDYTQADKWWQKATPKDTSQAERDKLRKDAILAGLASGAANWDYRTGWGGLIAGAGSGAQQAAVKARASELDHRDAFAKQMEQFAMQRAQDATGRSRLGAELQDTNAGRSYQTQVANTREQNQYNRDTYTNQTSNLQRAHETSMANAENMYKYGIEQAKLGQPQVQFSAKGALVQRRENGKVKLEYMPFGSQVEDSKELLQLKKQAGEFAPKYRQALYYSLFHEGNDVAVKYELAKDAINSSAGAQIFGQTYDTATKAIQQDLTRRGLAPGSKAYADEYNNSLAQVLSTQIDWSKPEGVEMLRKLSASGSIGASYLLGAVKRSGGQ